MRLGPDKSEACIVADPLLGLSQKRGRPGHIGTAYQRTDPDVEESGQRTILFDDPLPLASFSNNEDQIMQFS